MKRFAARWDDFWFRAVEPSQLALCRITYGAVLLWLLWAQDLNDSLTPLPDLPDAFRLPVGAFKYLPVVDPHTLHVLGIALALAIIASTIGFMTRVSTVAVFALLFYRNAMSASFGKITHYEAIPVILTGILMLSRCGDVLSVDAWLRQRWAWWPFAPARTEPSGSYRWPTQLAILYVALIYVLAALSKLQASGPAWALSDSMTVLLSVTPKNHGCYHTYSQYPGIAHWLVQHPPLPQVLASGTLLGELGAPLILIAGRVRYVYGAVLLFMNLAFYIVLGPDFRALMISFVFLVPWDQVLRRFAPATP